MRNLIFSIFTVLFVSSVTAQDIPDNLKDKQFVFKVVYCFRGSKWIPCTIGLNEGDSVNIWFRCAADHAQQIVKDGKELEIGVASTDGNDVTQCDNWWDSGDKDQQAAISKYVGPGPFYAIAGNGYTLAPCRFSAALRSGHLLLSGIAPRRYWDQSNFFSCNKSPLPPLGDTEIHTGDRYEHVDMHINVLQRNVHPPLLKTSMDFFNGINKFVPFSNLVIGTGIDYSKAVTVTEHPSVIRTAFENGSFHVMLGDHPITKSGEAVYDVTARNGYGESTVTFHLKLWASSIKVNAAENGTTDKTGLIGGTPGDVIEITATPADNYQFDGWDGDVDLTQADDNPLSLTVPENKQLVVTPKFSVKPYVEMHSVSLDFPPSEGYLVSMIDGTRSQYEKVPSGLQYEKNTVINLTANPKVGYEFKQWIGDVSVAQYQSPEISIVLTKDMTFGAVFEKKKASSNTISPSSFTSIPVPTAPLPTPASTTSSSISPELLSLLSANASHSTGASAFTPTTNQSNFGGSVGENTSAYQNALSHFGLSNKVSNSGGFNSSSDYSVRKAIRDGSIFQYKPFQDKKTGDYYYSNDQVEAERSNDFFNAASSLFQSIFGYGGAHREIGGGRAGH